jgi:ABC-type oligopeptide transport system ATPase subunit
MKSGRVVELALTEQLFEAPGHTYTRQLLAAVLRPDPDHRRIAAGLAHAGSMR